MDIFAGIDGTGPLNNAVYESRFVQSFVSRLYRQGRWGKSYYSRGPGMDGNETRQLSRVMLRELEGDLHRTTARKVSRVIVAGYSRGGAAAIRLCRELGKHGHSVDCLVLFDAVDMSLTVQADVVPGNVRTCVRAQRDPRALSRSSWTNCGTQIEDPKRTRLLAARFLCTHGGMGGVPWTKGDSDGVVNEALTDRELSGSMLRNGGAVVLPLIALNEAHRQFSRTTITVAKDKEVSERVGAWAFGCLDAALAPKKMALQS